jgi:hypothetical protein
MFHRSYLQKSKFDHRQHATPDLRIDGHTCCAWSSSSAHRPILEGLRIGRPITPRRRQMRFADKCVHYHWLSPAVRGAPGRICEPRLEESLADELPILRIVLSLRKDVSSGSKAAMDTPRRGCCLFDAFGTLIHPEPDAAWVYHR